MLNENELLAGAIPLDTLMHSKGLTPLSTDDIAALNRLQLLDVAEFSEAEVRAFFIDPIVRILGYEKGSIFSLDLERKIDFLDRRKFIDYKITLWKENFWIVEAKKPRQKARFDGKDLGQALEYAVHPEINSALIVLCDGRKIEVFDREVSLVEPILHVEQTRLVADFDKLRSLLGPWQTWFFQKRRIVRLLDKVFDKEFNLSRVSEFQDLIESRLSSKRPQFLENFRSQIRSEDDIAETNLMLGTSDSADLIEAHLFLSYPINSMMTMIAALVDRCLKSGKDEFFILSRMFPDQPRDLNDHYCMHTLLFLMQLHSKKKETRWLPSWLAGSERSLQLAIQNLIGRCLTSFATDISRKTILLAATVLRRVLKILFLGREDQWHAGSLFHAVQRHIAPELSWGQIVGSRGTQILHRLNGASLTSTAEFVRQCRSDREHFLPLSARNRLIDLWNSEARLLSSFPDYASLRKERSIGELHSTEFCNVTYDYLGHSCLCVLDMHPAWKTYTNDRYQAEVRTLAALGSWQAKEWLGLPAHEQIEPLPDQEIADRFFFGSVDTLQALRRGYVSV